MLLLFFCSNLLRFIILISHFWLPQRNSAQKWLCKINAIKHTFVKLVLFRAEIFKHKKENAFLNIYLQYCAGWRTCRTWKIQNSSTAKNIWCQSFNLRSSKCVFSCGFSVLQLFCWRSSLWGYKSSDWKRSQNVITTLSCLCNRWSHFKDHIKSLSKFFCKKKKVANTCLPVYKGHSAQGISCSS